MVGGRVVSGVGEDDGRLLALGLGLGGDDGTSPSTCNPRDSREKAFFVAEI